MSIVTIQPPKITLPSPSPLLKEQEVFHASEKLNENTSESTPAKVVRNGVAAGTFSSEYFRVYAAYLS